MWIPWPCLPCMTIIYSICFKHVAFYIIWSSFGYNAPLFTTASFGIPYLWQLLFRCVEKRRRSYGRFFPFFFFFFFFKLNVPGSVRSGKRRRAFPLDNTFFLFFFFLKRAGEGVITGKGLCTTCFASSKDCSEQSEHGVRSSIYPL